MCIVPDGDLYDAIGSGGASVVTDRIDRFTPDGIRLASGRVLEADIVVTATGLNMLPMGGITLAVDGADVELPETTVYKSMMLNGVPNFAFAIGYTNASWTLKVDLVCEHLCRLLAYMEERDADMVVPVRTDGDGERHPLFDLSSGYVLRGIQRCPHAGSQDPWAAEMAYERDVARLRDGAVDGPDLRFRTRVSPPESAPVAV
jgi:cation diffusion facilitator CzcD-associated flavoprotein CzcO